MAIRITRRGMLGVVAGATAGLAAPAVVRAQAAFPTRPIRVVVPFNTGGYNDRLARAFTPFLQERIGQPLVVVNRAGASGMLGHTYFLQQPDDGYSILCTSPSPYIPLNILLQNASFKVADFQMINLPSRDYTLMATEAGSALKSVDDVAAKLKADPTSLSIGVQPASGDYVNLVLFCDAHGIDKSKLRVVTYDGGGPARNATAGGVVNVGLVGGEGFLPLAQKIRPLMVFDDEKQEEWDAPFATEKGLKEFVAGSERGWVVQATMPKTHPDRYQFLVKAIEDTTKDPKVIEAMKKQQLAWRWYGPETSQKNFLRTFATMEKYIDILKAK